MILKHFFDIRMNRCLYHWECCYIHDQNFSFYNFVRLKKKPFRKNHQTKSGLIVFNTSVWITVLTDRKRFMWINLYVFVPVYWWHLVLHHASTKLKCLHYDVSPYCHKMCYHCLLVQKIFQLLVTVSQNPLW